MPEFACRIGTPAGEVIERLYTAESEAALRRELDRKELLVISLRRTGGAMDAARSIMPFRHRVKAKEFLLFNQEFMALIRAGLPILASLDILIERRKNPVFKRALIDIRDRIKSGESLSQAFDAQGLFPKIFSSSLASGERSGEIATMLKRFIVYSRTVQTIRKKVVGAMIYPTILMTLSIVLVGILVYYVVPTFSEFFMGLSGGKVDLPLLTRGLVFFSKFVRSYILIIMAGVIGGFMLFQVWKKTDRGRMAFDGFKLKLFLIGPILKSYSVSRFTRTLSTLVAGGIPLMTAIEITGGSVGNAVYERGGGQRRPQGEGGRGDVGVHGEDRPVRGHDRGDDQGRRVHRRPRGDADERLGLPRRGDRAENLHPGRPRRAADARFHGDRRRDHPPGDLLPAPEALFGIADRGRLA